jgi:xanthine dehydrogenase accessory factor
MSIPMVIIRGAGELASGVAHRLFVCGFRPIMLELAEPRMIRRTVCFAEAIYAGQWTIEGVRAIRAAAPPECFTDCIPVIVDPSGEVIRALGPHILIDARMKKRDVDLDMSDALLVIGIGPGMEVGRHAHMVIETKRGNMLGFVYREGEAIPDTGIPGDIQGRAAQRLLISPDSGIFENLTTIGERVDEGMPVARVGSHRITAAISGVVRGLLKDGLCVEAGEKVGDIDPRNDIDVNRISDKARAVGGGVLEAVFSALAWDVDMGMAQDEKRKLVS